MGEAGGFWSFLFLLVKAPKLKIFKISSFNCKHMEKEWTIDVPDHYEDDTFTVHGLITGLSFGAFQFQDLPKEAQEKIREEMLKRGRFGDTNEELYKKIKKDRMNKDLSKDR